MMKSPVFLALLLAAVVKGLYHEKYDDMPSYSPEYDSIQFENFGFDGFYYQVETLDESEECSCELSTSRTTFSGHNSPLDGEVSVHFRGPLSLSSFAYYVTDSDYIYGEDSGNAVWERAAFYESSSQTSENVTFLTTAGENNTCLGKALTYASNNGTGISSAATTLANDNLIYSDDEFVIMSNISCEDSGTNNDCGVYRSGIPAYHGFYGRTKMFLFEFSMPSESRYSSEDDLDFFNMPAIWLLNAHIPRTSQYPSNANCSCWSTGCGEFDIFEVMNTTQSDRLYSTVHDYQGSGDIQLGLQAYGYLSRDFSGSMRGGVVFDSNGTATVFMNNETSIDVNVSGAALDQWIQQAGSMVTDELDTVKQSAAALSLPKLAYCLLFASLAVFI